MANDERGHENDITVGMGKICWSRQQRCWILPGRVETLDAKFARFAATWINQQFLAAGHKPGTWSK